MAKPYHMYHCMTLLVRHFDNLNFSSLLLLCFSILAYGTRTKARDANGVTFYAGANAVEFIINHAEVSLVFVQEKKLPAVSSLLLH